MCTWWQWQHQPFAQYMGFRLGRLGIRCSYNLLPEYL